MDGFTELTNMIRMISVHEAVWLNHENILGKGAL